jgi:FAD:protein FMN transferase
MAAPLRLTVVDDGVRDADRAAEGAWAEVIDEFEASEQAMSRFRDTSDLIRLDREAGTGRPVPVPRRLERALVAADRAHRVTDGRFDPRLARALDRLGYAGAALGPPTRAEDARTTGLVAATASSDGPVVRRTGRGRMTVERPVDLGGIGKGLALRWAAARAEARGIGRYLLEAGGDLVVRGPGPGDAPWLVGIEDPAGGEALAAIAVDTGAVATSSVRIRSWVHEGRAVHHLLDPRTGEPAEGGLRAVTVLGPDPAWAEVWSKTLFIGGHQRITDDARRRGFAAWWVTDAGDLEMTSAARAATAWVAAET